MNIKKNIFWIVIAVIILAGLGVWAVVVPPVKASADELKGKCKAKVESFRKMADNAAKDDSLLTARHVELANTYRRKVEEQTKALEKQLETRKLDLRFDDADKESAKFDIWLSNLRGKIMKQAQEAGLQMPADADKLMFKEPATDENSREVERHRSYRLRQLAVVEEVVAILGKKWGKQQVLRFQPEKDQAELQEQVEAGVLALEKLTVTSPRSMVLTARGAGESRGGGGAGQTITTAEDRRRVWMEEAWKRAGKLTFSGKAPPLDELPYSVTSVDIQFVAPLVAAPLIVQALETSDRWAAVVSRIEYQRAAAPYPTAAEPKMAKAGPVPSLNTHYQEGPVRVLVSLDLYEYDGAKAKAVAAAAAAAAAADAKDAKGAKGAKDAKADTKKKGS